MTASATSLASYGWSDIWGQIGIVLATIGSIVGAVFDEIAFEWFILIAAIVVEGIWVWWEVTATTPQVQQLPADLGITQEGGDAIGASENNKNLTYGAVTQR